jgi:hypothetical protein
VFLGNDDTRVTGKDLLPTSAAAFDPMYGQDMNNGHDLGIVVLATPLKLTPVPINRASLAAAVGKPARYVGYGLTNGVAQSGDGIKRQATAPIAQVTRELIRIGRNPNGTCHGDSGGPLLMDNGAGEAVIGTVSFGDDATCRGNNYFQRLDTQVAWIDEQIKKYDPAASIPDAGSGGSGGGSDAGVVTADASVPDTARARDAQEPGLDMGSTGPADPLPLPMIHRDAGIMKPTPKPADARVPDADDSSEGDPSQYSQSVAGSACALAPPHARTGGAWLGGLMLASAACARRRRKRAVHPASRASQS